MISISKLWHIVTELTTYVFRRVELFLSMRKDFVLRLEFVESQNRLRYAYIDGRWCAMLSATNSSLGTELVDLRPFRA